MEAAGDTAHAAGSGGRSGARVQAASARPAARDAGPAAEDAAPARPREPDAPSGADEPSPQADAGPMRRAPRAGSAAPMKETEPAAGQGGSEPESGEEPAACDEQSCEPCHACGESGSCEAIAGRDDADSCGGERSCSSRGECLHVSEAHSELGTMTDYAELTTGYAQVLNFSEPASVVEIRLEVSCNENDETFPAVWIAAAPGGIPSSTIIATANVIYQEPTDSNTFALLELSKVIEQPDTGPIAIVVSRTDMACIVRLNREEPYAEGALFSQGAAGLWLPSEGSMVFQVLSSR